MAVLLLLDTSIVLMSLFCNFRYGPIRFGSVPYRLLTTSRSGQACFQETIVLFLSLYCKLFQKIYFLYYNLCFLPRLNEMIGYEQVRQVAETSKCR